MELQLELELEWELTWKLEWEMELQPHKPRELQPDPPKSGFGAKKAVRGPGGHPRVYFWGFWDHFSKWKTEPFAPCDPLYNSRFSLGDSHQKLTFKEP